MHTAGAGHLPPCEAAGTKRGPPIAVRAEDFAAYIHTLASRRKRCPRKPGQFAGGRELRKGKGTNCTRATTTPDPASPDKTRQKRHGEATRGEASGLASSAAPVASTARQAGTALTGRDSHRSPRRSPPLQRTLPADTLTRATDTQTLQPGQPHPPRARPMRTGCRPKTASAESAAMLPWRTRPQSAHICNARGCPLHR